MVSSARRPARDVSGSVRAAAARGLDASGSPSSAVAMAATAARSSAPETVTPCSSRRRTRSVTAGESPVSSRGEDDGSGSGPSATTTSPATPSGAGPVVSRRSRGRGAQQGHGDLGGLLADLLVAVEHDQGVAPRPRSTARASGSPPSVAGAPMAAAGRWPPRRRPRPPGDHHDAVGEPVGQPRGHVDRQRRLADASGTHDAPARWPARRTATASRASSRPTSGASGADGCPGRAATGPRRGRDPGGGWRSRARRSSGAGSRPVRSASTAAACR